MNRLNLALKYYQQSFSSNDNLQSYYCHLLANIVNKFFITSPEKKHYGYKITLFHILTTIQKFEACKIYFFKINNLINSNQPGISKVNMLQTFQINPFNLKFKQIKKYMTVLQI